ncbi:tetratricopeptide repeat protein [Minwuia thermotolerans]|uniref:Tetratricopeptide repeat protein 38 n=1 Tax=Minwuia thermotolerans TaxID=2056226 RepID=A0A2M9G741_9PROT|nr:tetratricopeptide repeat protein [Minwuia thermotolerans]PJK31532.1 tetratricopeptide repeat-containing protein [Minwuia thermotolerans]
MEEDAWGNAVTAASAEAARALDETALAYMGFRLDTGAHLKAALTADPEMPLALIYRGYFFLLFCHPALARKAAETRERLLPMAEGGALNARERLHFRALDLWVDGDMQGANDAWEAVMLDWPFDPMAIRLAHYTSFYMRGGTAMRRQSARVIRDWAGRDLPGAGFIHGVHAFSCEESGDYANAERHGRMAVEMNPADIWATHAVAHAMEMQGRHREGIGWIRANEADWNRTNNFRFHVWWHRCLYHLELGEHDEVLALYDRAVRAESTDEYLDITNGVAMLWRLEQEGVNVGGRWDELADRSAERVHDHILCFADMHYVMALAAAGREAEAKDMIAAMRDASDGDFSSQGEVYRRIGLPLAEAVVAARAGRHQQVLDTLLPVREDIALVGGSHAQRDVFERTLLESALAAGKGALARALAAERVDAKATSAYGWRRYADALDLCGDAEGARAARAEMARLAA